MVFSRWTKYAPTTRTRPREDGITLPSTGFWQRETESVFDGCGDRPLGEVAFNVRQRALAQVMPERLISIEAHHGSREIGRRIGNQCVLPVLQKHSFSSDRGCDHGQSQAHRLSDLAFHTRAVPERRHKDPCLVEIWLR